MKKILLPLLVSFLLNPFLTQAQGNLPNTPEKEVLAARQVLMRTIGMKSNAFQFEKIESDKGLDVFEVIALGGKVQVKGSNTIAMTRGAYEYLRKACNIQYTWSSAQPTLPSSLPDYTIARTTSPYKYRQYLNPLTFGISTAYWQWEDWERELDWMALHGINMPLAFNGQEAIWQKIYKEMGMTDAELSEFFTGPAFLPWQRLGNLNKHNGPLPQTYIKASADLQKQILIRMQQLGMTPIVPGFSGVVPAAYKRLNPAIEIHEMKGWGNFPDENKTYVLSPGNSDFVTIGKRFVEEYRKEYGNVHYFMADLFYDCEEPIALKNKENELTLYGKSISDAITAGDAEGIWVTQSSTFYKNNKFWDKAAVKSLLSQVSNSKMLIIDIANDKYKGWQVHEGFYGKPWIYGVTHNSGGKNQLHGNLFEYAADVSKMLANTKKGSLAGFGISPEGIDNNEIVYELLSDLSWASGNIEVKLWAQDFAKQRYGLHDKNAANAWLMLLGNVYNDATPLQPNLLQVRPAINVKSNNQTQALEYAADELLKVSENFSKNQIYKSDLAIIVSQYAANQVDLLLKRAMELHEQGLRSQSHNAFENAFELMLMMDGLLATTPNQNLDKQIELARKWSKIKEESDYFEADYKRLLTQFGNEKTPNLNESAGRLWSGLIRSYYMPRWKNYAASLRDTTNFNFDEFEYNWINTPGLSTKAPSTGDVIKFAKALFNQAKTYATSFTPQVKINTAYAGIGKSLVTLIPENRNLTVYYTTDGSMPYAGKTKYTKPFEVELPATIMAVSYLNDAIYGDLSVQKLKSSSNRTASLSNMPSEKYKSSYAQSLTDGLIGSANLTDGKWLGFEGVSISSVISFEKNINVSSATVSYLEDESNKIFAPSAIMIETSTDGQKFNPVATRDLDVNIIPHNAKRSTISLSFPSTNATHVRIVYFNRGKCPENHIAKGENAWLFIDEIAIQ